MRSTAKCYQALREFVETIPLVDCHDHSGVIHSGPTDAVKAVIDWYMRSDLVSASSDVEVEFIFNEAYSLEERWPVLEKAWQRTRFTGYAQVVRRALHHFYQEDDLTLEALQRISQKMIDFSDPARYEWALDQAGIVVRLEDINAHTDAVTGELNMPPRSRLVIGLPSYHAVRSHADVQGCAAPLGRCITSLDEYLDACREIFTRCKQAGAVAFKDQSAYNRPIDYGNPTRVVSSPIRMATARLGITFFISLCAWRAIWICRCRYIPGTWLVSVMILSKPMPLV